VVQVQQQTQTRLILQSICKCSLMCVSCFLRLNQMLYALCVSYHSNTEAALFACLSSGWVPQRVDCLAPTWEIALLDGLHDHFNRSRLSVEVFSNQSFFFFSILKAFLLRLIGWKKASIESRPRMK